MKQAANWGGLTVATAATGSSVIVRADVSGPRRGALLAGRSGLWARLHGWLKTTAVAAQLCIPALVAVIAAVVRTPNTRAAHAVLSNLVASVGSSLAPIAGFSSPSTHRHRAEPTPPSSRCRLASDESQQRRYARYTLMNRCRQYGWLGSFRAQQRTFRAGAQARLKA